MQRRDMARLYNSEKEYAKRMPKTYPTDYQNNQQKQKRKKCKKILQCVRRFYKVMLGVEFLSS